MRTDRKLKIWKEERERKIDITVREREKKRGERVRFGGVEENKAVVR